MSQVSPVADGPNFKTGEVINRALCGRSGEPKRTCRCQSCVGRKNKAKGSRGQSKARKQLENLTGLQAAFHGRKANEEDWHHLPVRVEVKAGKAGGANAVAAAFLRCEAQAAAATPIGDPRPFMAGFVPDGTSRVFWVIDGGADGAGLSDVIQALVNT